MPGHRGGRGARSRTWQQRYAFIDDVSPDVEEVESVALASGHDSAGLDERLGKLVEA